MRNHQMALTQAHVDRATRPVPDPGPEPHIVYHSDADYDDAVARMLAERPADGGLWLFAYGSLIWKPEFEHTAEIEGVARGWHRAFCFRVTRFRGSADCPGLMMALDRGGQCRGVLYRLPDANPADLLGKLFRREFTAKPPNSMPRWIGVEAGGRSIKALTFVMNRQSTAYLGKLPLEDVAETLAQACGHWGSGAEYLRNTVSHLDGRGIRDRNLWRLQAMVAERIDRLYPARQS